MKTFVSHIIAVVGVSEENGNEFRHLSLFPVAQESIRQEWSGWHNGKVACRLAGPFYADTAETACRIARKSGNMEKARVNAEKWASQLTYLELEAPRKIEEIVYVDENAEKEKKEKKERKALYGGIDLSALTL
jgi:hypothetical protein